MKGHLCQEIVEIRDTMIEPSITFNTNPTEVTLLERAENDLFGRDRAASASSWDNEDGAR